jgi:putative hemolysin
MSEIIVEVVILAVLIALNGVFAMSEMAVVSARRVRLQEQANSGRAGAQTALDLAAAPDRFLSTVQIGITLIGVLAGAFGGTTLAHILGEQMGRIAWLESYSEELGLGIVVLAITYGSLVFGELVPKRIALQKPERVAALIARPMTVLSRAAFPAVRLLMFSTRVTLRGLGIAPPDDPPVTEEEIRLLIEQGVRAGVFRHEEQALVDSVFRLDVRRISLLMTPHTEIVWLDVHDPPEIIRRKIVESRHTRFPVCRDGLDRVLGVIGARTLLARCLSGEPLDLTLGLNPPHFIPEHALAYSIVESFRNSDDHLLLVIDEHGSIQGLITEHDLLEAFVGDLPSPGDPLEPEAVQRQDGSWLLDGLMDIETVKRLLGIEHLPDEDRTTYETLGGFVMNQLGKIPTPGEQFDWGGLRFEVVDMDGRRVDKVLVAYQIAPPHPPEESAH